MKLCAEAGACALARVRKHRLPISRTVVRCCGVGRNVSIDMPE